MRAGAAPLCRGDGCQVEASATGHPTWAATPLAASIGPLASALASAVPRLVAARPLAAEGLVRWGG